jgi:hypothetical protein
MTPALYASLNLWLKQREQELLPTLGPGAEQFIQQIGQNLVPHAPLDMDPDYRGQPAQPGQEPYQQGLPGGPGGSGGPPMARPALGMNARPPGSNPGDLAPSAQVLSPSAKTPQMR